MNKDFVNKLMDYIDDPEIKKTIGRVSDNLDRVERMKNQWQHRDTQKARAQDIHAALTPALKERTSQAAGHIGLILTGGGGKGSYQAGVMKALEEMGISRNKTRAVSDGTVSSRNDIYSDRTSSGADNNYIISAVAGTSAGALNAALFAGGDAAQAETLWGSLDQSLFDGPEEFFGHSDENERYLEEMIRGCGVLSKISPDGLLTVATAFDYNMGRPKDFLLNTMDEDEKVKSLLASAAFPIALKGQIIKGIKYIDGGIPVFGSNMPVAPLYYLGFRRFIVVHCSSKAEFCEIAFLNKLNLKMNEEEYFNGSSFVHIFPSRKTGGLAAGTLNFSHDFIMSNIRLGYEDTQKALKDFPVFSENVGEYDEVHVVDGERYRSMNELLDQLS